MLPAVASADLSAFLDEGKQALVEGRYDSAVSNFSEALNMLSPDDLAVCPVLLGRAQAYIALHKLDEAIVDVNRALECDNLEGDMLATALRLRGTIHHNKGEKESALRDLTDSIKVYPQSQGPLAIAFTIRGLVLVSLRKYGRAQGDFRKAIQLNPDYAPAYAGLGMAYLYQGKEAKAKRAAEKALSMNPDEDAARIARQVLSGKPERSASAGSTRPRRVARQRASTRRQSVQETNSKSGSISVPIRTDGHVYVQVSFGSGRPYWFAVDTGATHTVIKRSLLKRISQDTEVTEVGRGRAKVADGRFTPVTAYLVKDAYLYDIPLGDIIVAVKDAPAGRVPNLLGARSLENVTFYLDTAARKAIFTPKHAR